MHHQIDQFDGSVIDIFCRESLLSNAADQLPTLPKSQCAYTVRDRYAVLGSIYYDLANVYNHFLETVSSPAKIN